VVAVAHDVGDLGQLGRSAEKQDNHFTLLGVKQGEEVVEHQAIDDLGLGTLDGDGVGQLDEPHRDLGAFTAELALEVLTGIGPVMRKSSFTR
jgi:hypothetical protein